MGDEGIELRGIVGVFHLACEGADDGLQRPSGYDAIEGKNHEAA